VFDEMPAVFVRVEEEKMEPGREVVGMGCRPLAAFAWSPFSVSSAMDASKRL
jgi:hypothetical protein